MSVLMKRRLLNATFLLILVVKVTQQASICGADCSAEDAAREDEYIPGLPNFPCELLEASAQVPTNARQVRPADIQVIAALGDSLTAANGAKPSNPDVIDFIDLIKADRGVSWSIGGDETLETVLTLPNILRLYNPSLYGYSTGSWFGAEYEAESASKYNLAQAMNLASHVVGQSERLVRKLQSDRKANSWKLITVLVGSNDVCKHCRNRVIFSIDKFKKNMRQILKNLNQLPRTIVNVVAPVDLTEVHLLPDDPVSEGIHKFICNCIYNNSDPDYARRASSLYQSAIEEVIQDRSFQNRTDFAITYHPFFKNVRVPRKGDAFDRSFVTTDRIHFSYRGHEMAALNLWNSMMSDPANRSTVTKFNKETVLCPTEERPYITIETPVTKL